MKLETFCSLRPALESAAEVPDPQAFRRRRELDDAVMQNGHSGNTILIVADGVARLSGDTALLAGTVIPASSLAGVCFTHQPPAAVRVSIEVEGIGRLTDWEEMA
jgi:2-keto-4-pentenoate hydratase/2-oxohepta-3-ene-1,7-dioic acid hydratase in catechol pathway